MFYRNNQGYSTETKFWPLAKTHWRKGQKKFFTNEKKIQPTSRKIPPTSGKIRPKIRIRNVSWFWKDDTFFVFSMQFFPSTPENHDNKTWHSLFFLSTETKLFLLIPIQTISICMYHVLWEQFCCFSVVVARVHELSHDKILFFGKNWSIFRLIYFSNMLFFFPCIYILNVYIYVLYEK